MELNSELPETIQSDYRALSRDELRELPEKHPIFYFYKPNSEMIKGLFLRIDNLNRVWANWQKYRDSTSFGTTESYIGITSQRHVYVLVEINKETYSIS